ncbi:(2Fe-2S) ferredoxin domain-containing protein [Streptomyces sp. NPDC007905]|uniref:(2Fe-2S) ferredoxin domain-containing protein n=1 Tax=Streptomyces sp. NPDC007905 TaxID=3364788 RepID=UPI0036E64B28
MSSVPPSSVPRALRDASARPCTVVVCRGCCCGNPAKYPGADHLGGLARLRAAAAEGGFEVCTSDCLGPCDQANVMVVRPSAEGRRAGGRPAWIGFALDDECTAEVAEWARAGGPGFAEPPLALELQMIRAPRGARARTGR